MDERFEQALELFGELCDARADEQARRLQALPDPAVRELVEELLFGDRGSDSRLESPLLDQLSATADADVEDMRPLLEIARWRIDESRYEERGEIGAGGMGRVLRVYDRKLGREVAMKVMAVTPGSEAGRQRLLARFLWEALLTGRLEHPSIVPVYDVGHRDDGELFFTMKLVDGTTLEQLLQRPEGLAQPRLLRILESVCEAVGFAHARGVVHRDLKPSNIMVGRFGEVQVMDWGIARRIGRRAAPMGGEGAARAAVDARVDGALGASAERSRSSSPMQTGRGEAVGTPGYMAPEQEAGSEQSVDERTDVFGVGAVLFRALSGQRPRGVDGRLDTSLPARDPGGARIPSELRAVCARALREDPADRYPSLRELEQDLRAFLEGGRGHAWRDGPLTLALKWAHLHRATTAALAAALALVVGGLFAFTSVRAATRERGAIETRMARGQLVAALHQDALRYNSWKGGRIDSPAQVLRFAQTLASFGEPLSDPDMRRELLALWREDPPKWRDLLRSLHVASIDFAGAGAALAWIGEEQVSETALAHWSLSRPALDEWRTEHPEAMAVWPQLVALVAELDRDPVRMALWGGWLAEVAGDSEALREGIADVERDLDDGVQAASALDLEWAGLLARIIGHDSWQRLFEAALERDPFLYWPNLLLGNAVYGPDLEAQDRKDLSAQFRRARRYYHNALIAEPSAPQVFSNLAFAYRDFDPELARYYGERAVELAPDNPVPFRNLGVVEWDLVWGTAEPDARAELMLQSARHLERALELSRDDRERTELRWMAGRSLVHSGEARGIAMIEEVALANPDHSSAWQELGEALWSAEPIELERSLVAQRHYLELVPGEQDFGYLLASRLAWAGRWPAALDVVQRGRSEHGWSVPEQRSDWVENLPLLVGLATGLIEARTEDELGWLAGVALQRAELARAATVFGQLGLGRQPPEAGSEGLSTESLMGMLRLSAGRAAGEGFVFVPGAMWLSEQDGEPDLSVLGDLVPLVEHLDDREPLQDSEEERARWLESARRYLLAIPSLEDAATPAGLRGLYEQARQWPAVRALPACDRGLFDALSRELAPEVREVVAAIWIEWGWLE